MKKYICLLFVVFALVGCKTSKQTVKTTTQTVTQKPASYLSSRIQLTLPEEVGGQELNGNMRMKSGELIQFSILMPILRSEILRLEITPDKVMMIDRMNRRYVSATKDELVRIFKQNVEFSQLEELLVKASQNKGKVTYTGEELGFAPFGDATISFSNFSDKPLDLEPTTVSDRFKKISVNELMQMFQNSL